MEKPPHSNPAPIGESPKAGIAGEPFASGEPHQDLKGRTIRGGMVTVASQFAQFFVYAISTVVLARLLSPEDFGIVGMVTAVVGILSLIKDSGLSMATLQRETVTRELISTVFWINVGLGIVITALSGILAPVLAEFYREPRLYWITIAVATTLLVDAIGAQHWALLRRQMRLKTVATIDILSAVVSVALAIAMAWAGFGYWALVAMRVSSMLTSTLAVWIVEPWRPGLPRRGSGAGSMMRFGGYLTGVELLNYSTRNLDNVLIGWYWGASSLGLYQKAYSLLMLPINQIATPIGSVAVGTLSRIQSDPDRLRRYFVGGYSIVTSIVMPIVVAVTIFADDIIVFVLGEQWIMAASLFRLLAPAALIGALLNPFGWLFISSGRTDRQLLVASIWSPFIILSFVLGLSHGPEGVAIGFSAMSALLAVPTCLYSLRGTAVSVIDVALALKHPFMSAVVSGLLGVLLAANLPDGIPSGVRAIGGCFLVLVSYAFVLLVVLRQWAPYRDVLQHLLPGRTIGKD